jgi:ACR3 family arsenite transporter
VGSIPRPRVIAVGAGCVRVDLHPHTQAAFLVVMALVGRVAGRLLRFDALAVRALLFRGATRNSLVVLPLALALGDAYALTAAVIVAQTLVELLGMLMYVCGVPLVPSVHTAPVA